MQGIQTRQLHCMTIDSELIIVLKIIVAFILGAFIGYDREKHGKDAGIRTYAAVCVGALLFTSIGEHLTNTDAASRIVANVIVGIGFLGAGIITRGSTSESSNGLTTAATIWCTAAVGVAIGLNMFIIAIVGASTLYFLLSLHHYKWYIKWKNELMEKDRQSNKKCEEAASD